jgi:hypothetical protein
LPGISVHYTKELNLEKQRKSWTGREKEVLASKSKRYHVAAVDTKHPEDGG